MKTRCIHLSARDSVPNLSSHFSDHKQNPKPHRALKAKCPIMNNPRSQGSATLDRSPRASKDPTRQDLTLPTGGGVTYSCGSCGYDLNLSSCNRNTGKIGSKYGRSIKRGMIAFFALDESKFSQKEELCCKPYISKSSWGLFQHRTKLMCRKCGNYIGDAYNENKMPDELQNLDYVTGSQHLSRNYSIKISSIHPSVELGSAFLAT